MKEELMNLVKNAYSPTYNFKVGCIVLMKDGKKFKGVNVENCNGTSICAERHAIGSAIANGYKKGDFDKLYVMTSGKKISSCCFICRQLIVEFFDKNSEIILMDMEGNTKTLTVSEMCPYPFDEEDL